MNNNKTKLETEMDNRIVQCVYNLDQRDHISINSNLST